MRLWERLRGRGLNSGPSLSPESRSPQIQKPKIGSSLRSRSGSPKEWIDESGEIGCRRRRILDFDEVLKEDVIDLRRLASMAWNGVPRSKRKTVWMLLLGYLPAQKSRQAQVLDAKRLEFEDALKQYFEKSSSSRSHREQQTLRQILVDVPRTCPGIPLFSSEPIQELMIKVLYVWSVRHPNCGYVQGMNDLLAIFILVFVADETGVYTSSNSQKHIKKTTRSTLDNVWSAAVTDDEFDDDEATDVDLLHILAKERIHKNTKAVSKKASSHDDLEYHPSIDAVLLQCDGTILSTQTLHQIAADTYWCLAKILDSIHDHYTHQQPGLLRASAQVQNLLRRVDVDLGRHLDSQGIQTLQVTFRWINCLLTRELPIPAIIRLWDTCIAEDQGFAKFFPYICAAFLCHFSDTLRYLNQENLHLFLSNLPTHDWKHKDVDTLLSEAFILTSLFQDSPSHLTPATTDLHATNDDDASPPRDDNSALFYDDDLINDNSQQSPVTNTRFAAAASSSSAAAPGTKPKSPYSRRFFSLSSSSSAATNDN